MPKQRYNWDKIAHKFTKLVETGEIDPTIAAGAKIFDVDYEYFRKQMKARGITTKYLNSQVVSIANRTVEVDEIGRATVRQINGDIEATYTSEVPRTVEQVAERCGIDLADFEIVKFEAFAREVYVKDIDKELEFDDGKITGHVRDQGKMKIQTIWSSRAVFRPRKIRPQTVEVVPVYIARDIEETNGRIADDGKDFLVIPDPHFGWKKIGKKMVSFHDPDALDAILEVANFIDFDRVIILGDLLDMTEWSMKFLAEPEVMGMTQAGLESAAIWLDKLSTRIQGKPIDILEGNHDKRFQSMLEARLPQGATLEVVGEGRKPLNLATYLGLDKMVNVNFVEGYPDAKVVYGGIRFSHGDTVATNSGGTVARVLGKIAYSIVFGHIHRAEYAEKTIRRADGGSERIIAYSPGCTCKIDGTITWATEDDNWQQGAGVVSLREQGVSVWHLPIVNGKILF